MTDAELPAQEDGVTHPHGTTSSPPEAADTARQSQAVTTRPARTGRPRRSVRLAAPTVRPLLGLEHQDAVGALSALLGDLVNTSSPNATASAVTSAAGTRRVLAELSSSPATIVTPARRRRAA